MITRSPQGRSGGSGFRVGIDDTHCTGMVRSQRDLETSTVLHVTNRGNDRQDIFSIDADWHLFEMDLAKQCERHGVAVLAYAWMTNHYHMVVECDDVLALPDMMRDFQSRYALAYNIRTRRTGSLFERPFYSRPVCDDADFLQTTRYVHLNPIDVVGERVLPSYHWSSLGVYLERRRAESWLATDRLRGMIDSERYLDDLSTPHHWDRLPLGDCPPRRRVTLEQVKAAIETVGSSLPSRTRNDLFAHIALVTRAAAASDVAQHLDVDPTTVRKRARRGRVAASVDPTFARLCGRVLEALG